MMLLDIMNLVNPNVSPFRSISYRFRDKNFFKKKNGKIAYKIIEIVSTLIGLILPVYQGKENELHPTD